MPRIPVVLAYLACMCPQISALRKSWETQSNVTIADPRMKHLSNGGVGPKSLKPLAALLAAVNGVNAAPPRHMARALMTSGVRQASPQVSPSTSYHHHSRAKPPRMAFDREEVHWTEGDDRMLKDYITNMKGPLTGPPREVIRDQSSVWILIFNQDKADEGVYTLQKSRPKNYVVAFEKEADAERFGNQLDASDFGLSTPTIWEFDKLNEFCEQRDFEVYFVLDDTLVLPPRRNEYDMEAYNKSQKGDAAERVSLERIFESDATGNPEDVAKLERLFKSKAASSYESPEKQALKRFIRQHRSRTGQFEELIKGLSVGWIVHSTDSVDPLLNENDKWRRWFLRVPESSALVFENREDAQRLVEELNSKFSHALGEHSMPKASVKHWAVQQWDADRIRAFCQRNQLAVALVPSQQVVPSSGS